MNGFLLHLACIIANFHKISLDPKTNASSLDAEEAGVQIKSQSREMLTCCWVRNVKYGAKLVYFYAYIIVDIHSDPSLLNVYTHNVFLFALKRDEAKHNGNAGNVFFPPPKSYIVAARVCWKLKQAWKTERKKLDLSSSKANE